MNRRKLYLYDPISNTKTETNYEILEGITEKSRMYLMSLKSKRCKITSINLYIVDDTFTVKELYLLMCREKPKDEIWKDIDGSAGRYKVSNCGRVLRVYKSGRTKLLIPYIRKNKWLHVKVTIRGKVKECAIHRLVATHFIENENGYINIYHKNDNKYDNHADNLAWIDSVTLGKITGHKSKALPVIKIDPLTNEILDEYTSMAEAGRFNYIHRETIRMCVIGKLKSAGGFKWAIDTEFCSGF